MSTVESVGNQYKKNHSIGRGRGKRSNQQKQTTQIQNDTSGSKSESSSKTPDKALSRRAPRGRGWRRPDQAIYVPRALRKKENVDSQSIDDGGEDKACQLIKKDEGIFTDSDSFCEQKGTDRHSLARQYPEKDETAVSVVLNKDQKSCDISNEKGAEAPVEGSSESSTANSLNSNEAVLLDINKKTVDIFDINQDDSYEKKTITESENVLGNKQRDKILNTEDDTCGKSCPETDAKEEEEEEEKEEEELQKHEDKKEGDNAGAAEEIQVIDKCQSRPLVSSCSDRIEQLGQNLLENQDAREIPFLDQQKPVIESCQSNSSVESVRVGDNANNEEETSLKCQERQENNISTDQQQCTSNTSLVLDESITEADDVKKEEGELSEEFNVVERIETKGEEKQNQGNDVHQSSSTVTDVSTEMYYPQVGMCATFPDAAVVETDSKHDEIHDEEYFPKETSSSCVFNDVLMDLKDESYEILNGNSEQNHQLYDKSDSHEVEEVTSDVKDGSEKNITLSQKQDDAGESDNFKDTETQGSIESEEEKNNIALDVGNTEEGKVDSESVVNNEKKSDEKETKVKKKSKKKKGEDLKEEKKKKKSKKKEVSENEEVKEKENVDKHKLKKKEKKKASKEGSGTKSKESKSKEKAKDKKEQKSENGNEDNDDDDDDESWESKFNEDGECLDPELLEELTEATGIKKPSKRKTQFDYYALPSKEVILDDDSEYGHIVELYDFSPELKTQDLVQLLSSFKNQGYEIKWVDDTHALAVFSSEIAAKQAIQMCSSPIMKLRPVSQGTSESKSKAKKCFSFPQPYKPRPQTTNLAAHRLVTGALGVRSTMSKEEREREREKLKEAKEQKRQEKQRKADVWGD